MESSTIIDEKQIEENTTINEEKTSKKVEEVLKDLKEIKEEGIIDDKALKTLSKEVVKKLISPKSEEKSQEIEEPTESPTKENKPSSLSKTNPTQQTTQPTISQPKPQEQAVEKPQQKESIEIKQTFTNRRLKELNKMIDSWKSDIKALSELHEHGIISDEEYNRSREEIEKKIAKVEEIIKRELEKEQIEALKKHIEEEIREALNQGIFKQEEEELKKDLQALESLYARGLISEEDYEKKKQAIESKLKNYTQLIELIDAIFDKFIKDIESKIEPIQEQKPQPKKQEPKKEEQKQKPLTWYQKILKVVGLYKEEKEDSKENTLITRIKEVYENDDNRFKISNMALEIKKEVKAKLGINKSLTYNELIEEIKKSDKFDDNLKNQLIDYFNEIIIKEYLEDEDEKDIEEIYKKSIEIAQYLQGIKSPNKPIKKQETSKTNKSQKNEDKKEETEEITEVKERMPQKQKQKSKSIFQKINDFFGV